MKVKFKLSRLDLVLISIRGILNQPIVLSILGIVLIVTSYLNWTAIDKERAFLVRIITLIVLELVPIGLFFLLLVILILLTAMSSKNSRLLTEQTLRVDDERLIIESELSKSEIQWPAVQRLIQSGPYLFLYFSQQAATVIPKRAFESSETWQQFFEFCRGKVNPG